MAEFDLSNGKESCVGEAFVKGESVLGIRKYLISIFLWEQHPDLPSLFGLTGNRPFPNYLRPFFRSESQGSQ